MLSRLWQYLCCSTGPEALQGVITTHTMTGTITPSDTMSGTIGTPALVGAITTQTLTGTITHTQIQGRITCP